MEGEDKSIKQWPVSFQGCWIICPRVKRASQRGSGILTAKDTGRSVIVHQEKAWLRPHVQGQLQEVVVLILHRQMCCCFSLHATSTGHLLRCKPYPLGALYRNEKNKKLVCLPLPPFANSLCLLPAFPTMEGGPESYRACSMVKC